MTYKVEMDMDIPGAETTYEKMQNYEGIQSIWGQMGNLVLLELRLWIFVCESGQQELRVVTDEVEEII